MGSAGGSASGWGTALLMVLGGLLVSVGGVGAAVSAFYLVEGLAERVGEPAGSMNADLMEGLVFVSAVGLLVSAGVCLLGVAVVRSAARRARGDLPAPDPRTGRGPSAGSSVG